MKHGSLFSGIGGFDLAAEWMGWENVFHCENNKFCQKILKYYWPNATSYGDIKETDFSIYRGRCGIVTGGFPCQPFSLAGKRKGTDDDRYLWKQMLRAAIEIQPDWLVGENVPGLLTWGKGMVLDEIKADLEAAGFEVFPPLVLPACSKNAPHKRERLWIIAHSVNGGYKAGREQKAETNGIQSINRKEVDRGKFNGANISSANPYANGKPIQRRQETRDIEVERKITKQFVARHDKPFYWDDFPTQPAVCGRNDGVSNRVDRIKGLGNAVVPQVVYEIFKAIEMCE